MTQSSEASTVAALCTAYGRAGLALLRLSGPQAFEIVSRVFRPAGGRAFDSIPARRATYGDILYRGEPIDDGLLTLFQAPHSFTGEDCAEISCHGGLLLVSKIYEALLEAGASPAGPGEFSKRAFLNGKISLTGAEAIIDLINAETEEQLRLAENNRRGRLSEKLKELYERLTDLLARVYVYIDYPDEDLCDLSPQEFAISLSNIRDELSQLLDSYKTGHAVMEGIPTVIAGKPNTGKSSLLNLLVGKNRAIVSPVAGTTRDTVEETVTVGKVLLRLCDTAGLRETEDPVEKMGVERSREKLESAELILAVFDRSAPATAEDLRLIEFLRPRRNQVLALLNKADLPAVFDSSLLRDFKIFSLCALEKEFPEELSSEIENLFTQGTVNFRDRAILTNARQAAATSKALETLDLAVRALEMGETQDMAALDAELALNNLAEIDGKCVGEDIVSAIFSRFCVGK